MPFKSKAAKENERWMLETAAIERIMAADECDKAAAKKQLEQFKAARPFVVRYKPLPWGSMPVSQESPPISPPQVLQSEIDQAWPAPQPSIRVEAKTAGGGVSIYDAKLPEELGRDSAAAAAFKAMIKFAACFKSERRGPPSRDVAARAANSAVTQYPIGKARDLYRYLPADLRNPSRTPPK